MKLLIDENLSRKLPRRLEAAFPGSTHVEYIEDLGAGGVDSPIWEYAKKHDFIVMTKDLDFIDKSKFKGNPPDVINLAIGNARYQPTLAFIQANENKIKSYFSKPHHWLLVLR